MKKIIIECSEMETQDKAHAVLAKTFGMQKGSIHDMESLYELLLSIQRPMEITFEDMDLLDVYLEDYGQDILDTFERAASENDTIKLV